MTSSGQPPRRGGSHRSAGQRRPVEQRPRSDVARRAARSGLAGRRLTRTIVLGSLAVLAALAWLADTLDMDTELLKEYALTALLLVGVLVVAGLVGAALLWLVKRLFR